MVLFYYKTLISSKPDEAMGRISVKNGGPSRKGEKRKNLQSEESKNRYAGSRKKQYCKSVAKRKAENVELSKEGLYTCGQCEKVKPEEDFPQHVTTGKFSGYESCRQCLDDLKTRKITSGVTQEI